MIIALTGPKGSGKDTVARIMAEEYAIQPIAFADPIKQRIQHIFKLKSTDDYDVFKRSSVSAVTAGHGGFTVEGRHVVREIGMLMREYDEHQFTDYVRRKVHSGEHNHWAITDLRFDNEYLLCRSMGAHIVKIIRPQYDYDGHITERGFDDHLVDSIIMNDGDLDFLRTRVQIIMDKIFKESA